MTSSVVLYGFFSSNQWIIFIVCVLIAIGVPLLTYFWVRGIDSSSEREKELIKKFVEVNGRSPSSDELVKLMGGSYE